MEKQEVKEGILFLLKEDNASKEINGDGMGYSLLEIKEYLKLNGVKEYIQGQDGLKKLQNLLAEMENERLIEKRILGGNLYDYSIENPGYLITENNKDTLKEKWILPDDND